MFSFTDLARVGLAFALVACGGDQIVAGDAETDAGVGDAPCTSDSYAVCNGPNGCFAVGTAQCPGCSSALPNEVGLCYSTDLSEGFAQDGQVYIQTIPQEAYPSNPYPFEVGVLFAANGGASRVRYADWSEWDGAALPEPATCPTFTSFRICGGACSGCLAGETCTGRSPNHPYGICLLNGSGRCASLLADGGFTGCDAGEQCFTFQSTPSGQPLADQEGLCITTAGCQEALTSYPGGAFCHDAN